MERFIFLAILAFFIPAQTLTAKDPQRNLTALSGTYTFNFSDTDEDAVVNVQFRKNNKEYHLTDWLADGKMEDRLRKRKVTFSGAYVSTKLNGDVIVDAEFVCFKLVGKRLEWLAGYKHPLFKQP